MSGGGSLDDESDALVMCQSEGRPVGDEGFTTSPIDDRRNCHEGHYYDANNNCAVHALIGNLDN